MIPIRDSQWRSSTPHVTRALIIINALVWLFMLLTLSRGPTHFVVIADNDALESNRPGPTQLYPVSEFSEFTLRFGAVPELVTSELAGKSATHDFIEGNRVSRDGQFLESGGVNLFNGFLLLLTPLTAMFIHGGWLHVIGNLLFLWVFGDNVEDRMGHTRFALFYFISGYVAAAAHIYLGGGDLVPMIGASGAISGVLGAYLLLFPRALVQVLIPIVFFIPMVVPAPLMIGFWFLFNIFNGIGDIARDTAGSGGTAWWAHIGGFAAGLLLVYPFLIGRWRAPAGEIAPQWNLPTGLRGRFRRPPQRPPHLHDGIDLEVPPEAEQAPADENPKVRVVDLATRQPLIVQTNTRRGLSRLRLRLPSCPALPKRKPGSIDAFRDPPA
jgi:membrane associated rhomboid family serine protease